MRQLAASLALLTCLVLAACGGDAPEATPGEATATDAATVAAADTTPDVPPPLPSGDFRIVSLALGTAVDEEGQVRQPTDRFGSADTIHAAVVGVGSSDGLTLSARWTRADGTQVAKAGQNLAPSTPTVTTFSISQPEPWPAGDYRVEIAINEQVVESRDFRIE